MQTGRRGTRPPSKLLRRSGGSCGCPAGVMPSTCSLLTYSWHLRLNWLPGGMTRYVHALLSLVHSQVCQLICLRLLLQSVSLPDHIASRAHSLYINNMLAVVVNYAAELLPLHETAGIYTSASANSPHTKRKSQLSSPQGEDTKSSNGYEITLPRTNIARLGEFINVMLDV